MTWTEVRFVTAGIALLIGALFLAIGALGIVRLPDVLCRNHAAAKALTLGITLMLVGLWLARAEAASAPKIVLAIVFQLLTIPIAGHLVAHVAHAHDAPRWRPPEHQRKDD